MELRDIISGSHPAVRIPPTSTVGDALVSMMENKTDFVLIDRSGPHDAYGIVTRWDLVEGPIADGRDLDKASVLEYARRPLVTLNNLDLDLRWVAKKMANENVSKIAVFDKDEFLGFISDVDLMRAALVRARAAKKKEAGE